MVSLQMCLYNEKAIDLINFFTKPISPRGSNRGIRKLFRNSLALSPNAPEVEIAKGTRRLKPTLLTTCL